MAARFSEHEAVRLRTDRFAREGARAGMRGLVVHVYGPGAYEVHIGAEDGSGDLVAHIEARDEDLEADVTSVAPT